MRTRQGEQGAESVKSAWGDHGLKVPVFSRKGFRGLWENGERVWEDLAPRY